MTTLILYASVEGHTRKIAGVIEGLLQRAGESVVLVDGGQKGAAVPFDGIDRVILAASVHRKRHLPEFEKLVTAHRGELSRRKTLFLSVSLCAGFAEGLEEAQSYVDDMRDRTGFAANRTLLVGGALQFEKYLEYEAWIIRIIALGLERYEEAQTDRELTDWAEIERDVIAFLEEK